MAKNETIKVSVRIDKDTYTRLCKMSSMDNKGNISQIIREYIDIGLGIKSTTDDIEKISSIIKRQVEIVCQKPIERLIKIGIKNIKSTESNRYVTYEMMKEFSQGNIDEILENAEKQAVLYATNRNG